MNRRTATLLALAGPLLAQRALAASPTAANPLESRADEIALLAYPKVAGLDLLVPQYMFAMLAGANVHIVAKTRDTIVTDTGVSIAPTKTFSECPKDLTVLFAPGGASGTIAAMRDSETMGFVADRGARATYVTSVCTGALVLGAAGLLRGYRATTHWSSLDVLQHFGATMVRERVVKDRNRITGGGVTAGLDFGLAMIAEMRSKFYAEFVQLLVEYSPQPPFNSGSPTTAPANVAAYARDYVSSFVAEAEKEAPRNS